MIKKILLGLLIVLLVFSLIMASQQTVDVEKDSENNIIITGFQQIEISPTIDKEKCGDSLYEE